MRLFTAAIPPPEVAADLAALLDGLPGDWVPRDSWHITLGYYGEEADTAGRAEWIRAQVEGLTAPEVSLTGVGHFPRTATLWMGVSAVDSSFTALGRALRWNDRHEWSPHLTIGHGEPMDLPYEGPKWTINEFVLLGADLRHSYTVIERFRFDGRPGGHPFWDIHIPRE
jgi:RNA 2',3'-cyclic 3'-phosphodiesterase